MMSILLSSIAPLPGFIIMATITFLLFIWYVLKFLWRLLHTVEKSSKIYLLDNKSIKIKFYKECYEREEKEYTWRIVTGEKLKKEHLEKIVEEYKPEGYVEMYFYDKSRFLLSPYAQYKNYYLEYTKNK